MRRRLVAGVWLVGLLLTIVGIADEQTALFTETEPLDIRFKRLSTLRLQADGSLLAADSDTSEIKIIGTDGKVVRIIKMEFGPESIDVAPDGSIYCGGAGKIAKLDKDGKILATAESPVASEQPQQPLRRARSRTRRVSGLAVSDKDVFAAFGKGGSTSSISDLYRFDLNLKNPTLIKAGLRGCCQRCDMVFKDGVLHIAENAVHRVVQMDRDGKPVTKWGSRDRNAIEGFGSCCNPMNLCFGSDGLLYTAESGLGRIKRYTADGEFRGLVGYVGTQRFTRASGLAASCSNIAIDITSDGRKMYVMDYQNRIIRVLEKNE